MKITLEFSSHEELVAYCRDVLDREPLQPPHPRSEEEAPVPPGKRLRAWREARGWNQGQLGSALGYSLGPVRGKAGSRGCPMVSYIENGKYSPGREVRRVIEKLTGIAASAWRTDD
jgi:ribosome-binding protein aMBF1 (putative translation factor)